jgi:hypothetical protein
MNQYQKINTVFKRDMTNHGKIIVGEYSEPEFEYLKDNIWDFTEKVDGTNIRVMWDGEAVTFGGKTDNAQLPVLLLYKLQELFEGTIKKQLFIEKFGIEENTKVCLYGEGYGAKIQSGGKYIKNGVDFVLFDVKIGDWWLQRKDVVDIANYFGIKVVPIIGFGTLSQMVEITKKGFYSQWGNFIAEGIVARPQTELKTRRGDKVITKIKYKDLI